MSQTTLSNPDSSTLQDLTTGTPLAERRPPLSSASSTTREEMEDDAEKVAGIEDSEKTVKIDQPPPLVFPDGGMRAWLTVAGGFAANFCCYGVVTSFGAFQEHYRTDQLADTPLSTISWIGSFQLCLVLLVGCISGPAFDAGYLKTMIASGGALYVFCLMMTSISTKYYQFLLSQGLGVGIAMGLLFAPTMATVGHHFQKRRMMAFGIFSSGASLGGTVLPIAMRRLFVKVGFGWAVRILAFIVLLCVVVAFFCCSTRLPPRAGSRPVDFRVFRDIDYAFLIVGAGLCGLGLYAPVSFGVTFAVQHHVSTDLAFYSLSVLNACSVIGRIIPNIIAQKMGPLNVLTLACSFSGVMLFCWVETKTTAAIYVFMALFGIMSGAYVALLPASVSSLTKNINEIGLRLGMAFFSTSFCWLASAPIQGALIRTRGGYWACAGFSGGTVFLGVGFILAARHLASRRKGTPWV
ncbi:MFS general substrate transporter [Meredithblackwellia eburnea MCA 4105]